MKESIMDLFHQPQMTSIAMQPRDFLGKLKNIGINVDLQGENLRISKSNGNVPPELIDKIKSNKQELVDFLKLRESTINFKGIEKAANKEYYTLSNQQERLYLIYKLDEQSTAYNLTSFFELKGNIDINKIESTFKIILQRHQSLRTQFIKKNETTLQRIRTSVDFKIELLKTKGREKEQVLSDFVQPFNLAKDILFRVGIAIFGENKGMLLFDAHHIVFDGISQGIIVKEFISIYSGVMLTPTNYQYSDFSEWQNSDDFNIKVDSQREYWLNEFNENVDYLTLSSNYTQNRAMHMKGKSIKVTIDGVSVQQINTAAIQMKVTRFSYLFSVYATFLYLISQQRKFVIGTPTTGRNHHQVSDVIGMFVNTLPIKVDVNNDLTFQELASALSQNITNALECQDFSFESLIKELKINAVAGQSPLFNTWFFYNRQTDTTIELPDLTFSQLDFETDIAKWDLTLQCLEREQEIDFIFNYPEYLFDDDTINYYLELFKRLMLFTLKKPNEKISDISLLDQNERKAITVQYNSVSQNTTVETTVVNLFMEQAMSSPDKIAAKFYNDHISYGELNRKSNLMANLLLTNGVLPQKRVGIMLDRSLDLIITILGILKLGASYIPLNPKDPLDRKTFILKDSNCHLVVTDEKNKDLAQISGWPILRIDDCDLIDIESIPEDINLSEVDSSAYIIYTSGTTGTPKGVNVAHRSLNNYISWASKYYDGGKDYNFALYTSVFFDMVITSIFVPLVTGNSIIIYSKDDNDFLLDEILVDNQVQIIKLTPSQLRLVVNDKMIYNKINRLQDFSLKGIIVGGEKFETDLAQKASKFFPKEVKLYNEYGPTEATVGCMVYEYSMKREIGASVSIGNPIDNVQIYILNENLDPLPYGVPGELCIAGKALAIGYLSNADLNKESFVDNPYEFGTKLYKTGDVAMMLPNLMITYLGRKDNQVKIRGYRVEIGEVEKNILKCASVSSCAVMARSNLQGELDLYAYIVWKDEVDLNSIKVDLANNLPAYMVPSYFIPMEELPMTASGKLDRKSLPDYGHISTKKMSTSKEEQVLYDLWKEVLNLDDFGVDENFYQIGGDSIRAIRLISKINNKLNLQLKVKDLFNNATVELLAAVLQDKKNTNDRQKKFEILEQEFDKYRELYLQEQGDAGNIEDVYPVSDIQLGMLFHTLKEPDSTFYHDQMVHQVYYENFNADLFSKAFDLLILKHSVLRTFFEFTNEERPVQVVLRSLEGTKIHHDISHLKSNEQNKHIETFLNNDVKESFNIFKGPLWRFTTFAINKNEIVLVWVIHHAIIDGWSDSAFKAELHNVYQSLLLDSNFRPKFLKSSYKDYVLEEVLNKKEGQYLKYWKNELAGYVKTEIHTKTIKSASVNIRHQYKRKLKPAFVDKLHLAQKTYGIDLKQLCLGAYLYAIYMFSMKNDILVGLIHSNRPEIEDGDKVLGCFLNVLPVRLVLDQSLSWEEYFVQLSEKYREVVNNGKITFVDILEAIGEESGGGNAILDFTFNFVDFHALTTVNHQDSKQKLSNELNLDSYSVNNFLLDFTFSKTLDDYNILLNYSPELMDEYLVHMFCDQFEKTIYKLLDYGSEAISKALVLSPEERSRLLWGFNSTDHGLPANDVPMDLFDSTAVVHVNTIALLDGEVEVSYG
ncbi:amino acid adenylation domain-containing protein, partial [Dokdonia sp.]|uniref:amino acid adenylation domain-containing protein n=1 Tax=Dokdonia sp. TaxID=2024995 RepID=UPI0032637F0C